MNVRKCWTRTTAGVEILLVQRVRETGCGGAVPDGPVSLVPQRPDRPPTRPSPARGEGEGGGRPSLIVLTLDWGGSGVG